MVCQNCARSIGDRESTIVCDNCKLLVHASCSNLTPEELKKRALRQTVRNLKYFCDKCNDHSDQFKELKNILQALTIRFTSLEDKINNFENKLLSSRDVPPTLFEEIISELQDRTRRQNNVIIYGLDENPNSTLGDMAAVNNVMNITSNADHIITASSVIRLGKIGSKPRPVKVVLPNPFIARTVLKNKKRLLNSTYKTVKIQDDLTKRQLTYLQQIRNDLNERIAKGENNLTIRYIKQIPTIVEKTGPLGN